MLAEVSGGREPAVGQAGEVADVRGRGVGAAGVGRGGGAAAGRQVGGRGRGGVGDVVARFQDEDAVAVAAQAVGHQ